MSKTTMRYLLVCQGGNDRSDAPTTAVADIDHATAKDIVRLAAVALTNDLHRIEHLTSSVVWLLTNPLDTGIGDLNAITWTSDDEARTEMDRLLVDCDTVKFCAYDRDSDDLYITDPLSIADVACAFGIPFGPDLGITEGRSWQEAVEGGQATARPDTPPTPLSGIVVYEVTRLPSDSSFSLSPQPGGMDTDHTHTPINPASPPAYLELHGWRSFAEAEAFVAGVNASDRGDCGCVVQTFAPDLTAVLVEWRQASGMDLTLIDHRG